MRDPMVFDPKEMVLQTATAAGIGAAVGGPPGAVAGGVSGFLGYVLGWFGGKSAQGLFDLDEEKAEVVRRFIEVALPVKSVGSTTELGQAIIRTVKRAPKPVAAGIRYGAFGLATGYVAEPYVLKDGDANATELLGLAGLSAVGLRAGQFLAPLGIWGAYSTRQVMSVLSEGKYGAGVWLTEPGYNPALFKRIFGKEVELPRLSVERGKIEVKAKDVFWEGLFYSREQVAQLMQDLKEVQEVFDKYGIKIGSKVSQKLGEELFDPVEQAEMGEKIRAVLRQEGLLDKEIDEIAEAITSLQRTSLKIADRLAEVGGTRKEYLDTLGGEKRVFQHVFSIQEPERRAQIEILRSIRGRREAKLVLPSAATLRKRGLTRRATSEKMIRALEEQTGRRKPKLGDKIAVDGRIWTYTKLKEGGRTVWWSEFSLEEFKEKGAFVDLAASVYRQISEDLGLVRQLEMFDYLGRLGKETGRVVDRPIEGYILLSETGQSLVVRGWGNLTGKYVSPELYRSLRAYVEMDKYVPSMRKLARVNFRWKAAFLSLNFKSYVNALLGNMILTFANGHDPAEIMYHYVKGLKAKDRLFEEAKKHGLLKASLRWERIVASESDELERLLRPSKGRSPIGELVGRPVRAFAKFTDYTAERWYGKVDEVFRYGLYRKLRQEGLGEEEAARISLQTYAYYGDLPVIVRSLRDTIMPFISYQVRIFPQIFKAFLKYPERFAITLAFIEGIQRQAFKEMYGENWREGQRYEELVRPAYMEERIGGLLADFVRVPEMEFDEGVIPSGYMYIGFLPWNIPLSIPHLTVDSSGNTILPSYLATILIQNPVLRWVSGLFMHTDPATGRKVYEMAGPGRPVASLLQYTQFTLLPSQSFVKYPLQIFAKEGWFDPIVSWYNYFGTYPNGEPVGSAHMMWNTVAPTVLQFDPHFNVEMALRRLEGIERGYKRQYRRAERRGAPLPVLEENWGHMEDALEENWRKRAEIMEQYFKAEPKGR